MPAKSFSIELNKNTLLNITVALFISASAIRSVAAQFLPSPVGILTVLFYALLAISCRNVSITKEKFLRLITPLLIFAITYLITWFAYPERHFFYATSLYNIQELLTPIYGVYIAFICLLQDSNEDRIFSLKLAGYIMGIVYAWQSLDIILNGYWTRGTIYDGTMVTIQSNYNLTWGYNVYAVCVIFLSLYYIEQKTKYLLFSIIGLTGILFYGSRGALILFAVFFLLILLLSLKNKPKRYRAIVIILIIMAVLLLATGTIGNILVSIAEKTGNNSRTVEKILSGSFLDSEERINIYHIIIDKIKQSPFFGWGIFADRYFLNLQVQGGSAYSHNIFLEMLISFGVFGLLFIIWIIYRLAIYIKNHTDTASQMLLMIGIGGSLPLLLSLSFWFLPLFWYLIALLLSDSKLFDSDIRKTVPYKRFKTISNNTVSTRAKSTETAIEKKLEAELQEMFHE